MLYLWKINNIVRWKELSVNFLTDLAILPTLNSPTETHIDNVVFNSKKNL